MKEHGETETDTDAERTPQKLGKASFSAHKSCSLSASSSLLSLQVIRPPRLPTSSIVTPVTVPSSDVLTNHITPSPSVTLATPPGNNSVVSMFSKALCPLNWINFIKTHLPTSHHTTVFIAEHIQKALNSHVKMLKIHYWVCSPFTFGLCMLNTTPWPRSCSCSYLNIFKRFCLNLPAVAGLQIGVFRFTHFILTGGKQS